MGRSTGQSHLRSTTLTAIDQGTTTREAVTTTEPAPTPSLQDRLSQPAPAVIVPARVDIASAPPLSVMSVASQMHSPRHHPRVKTCPERLVITRAHPQVTHTCVHTSRTKSDITGILTMYHCQFAKSTVSRISTALCLGARQGHYQRLPIDILPPY